MSLRPALPSLAGLHAALPTGAAHYGVSSDASTALHLIALSRLVRAKDEGTLRRAASSPIGVAVVAALRALTLRVASSADGLGSQLNEANMLTMFNLSGSSTKYESQYGSFGSLQARLPWPRYRALVSALLEALTASRRGQVGYAVGQMLLAATPTTALNAEGQAAIAALIAALEPAMRARLATPGAASSSSGSGSSSQRTTPPPEQQPPSLPLPAPPPPPLAIDPMQSLRANLRRVIETRLNHQLSPSEAATVGNALAEGLSVLQAGGEAARQQLLGTNVLVALTSQGGAWLWASTLEATEQPVASIGALATAIVDGCSAMAATLFASAAIAFETATARGTGPCITARRVAGTQASKHSALER